MSSAIANLRSFMEGARGVLHRNGVVGPKAEVFPYICFGNICYCAYALDKDRRVKKRIDEERKKINEEREKMGMPFFSLFIN